MKIVLIGASLTGNKGASAMCLTVIDLMKKRYKNNIDIAILSPRPEHDTDIAKRLDLKIFTYKNVLRKSIPNAILKIFFKWTPVENDTVLDAYEWADCIIDIHGINFSDSDTLISTAIIPSAQILLAALLKKPLIKFTQTFGPMKRVSIKIFARLFLPLAKALFPREKTAFDELKSLKLRNVMNDCVDSAFLLPSQLPNNIQIKITKKIRVAFIPNAILLSKSNNYKEACICLLNKIIEHGCHPVIIMHYSKPSSDEALLDMSSNNDYKLINEIISATDKPDQVEAHIEEYSPSELKGIIGTCDISVPSRYHALVASISQAIPSFCIGWAGKYEGLLERVNLKHFSFSTDSYGNFDIDRINLSFLNFLEDYKSNKLNINDQVNILKDNSRESYKTLFKLIDER